MSIVFFTVTLKKTFALRDEDGGLFVFMAIFFVLLLCVRHYAKYNRWMISFNVYNSPWINISSISIVKMRKPKLSEI